jgi:ATP-dependent DNA helicase RecQ
MLNPNPGSREVIDRVFQNNFSSVGDQVRPIQRDVIQSVVTGHNTLALMPTGSGKSLCYWIAGLIMEGTTLVVSPLTALMDEQTRKLEAHGRQVLLLHSGVNTQKQLTALVDLYKGTSLPDFIFVSPERIATDGFLAFVLRHLHKKIQLVVIDEAHCISQWGLDFRPFYKEIPYFLNEVFGQSHWPVILGLTATLNPKDLEEICQDFKIEAKHVIRHRRLLRNNIKVKIVKVPDENAKDEAFWQFLDSKQDEKILIYLDRKRGKRSTEGLCTIARKKGYRAAFFHGDMSSDEKAEVIENFKTGELRMVFATSAFGMGIDIPDIRGVIHYLLTDSTESYYQQIGRVGRDGLPAWAVLFYSDKNVLVRKRDYIEKSFPDEEAIRQAFRRLTAGRFRKNTINYFDEGDKTQSGYHYLVRSEVIQPVCKGITHINVFSLNKGVSLPSFEHYQNASHSGLLILIAKKLGLDEHTILSNVFRWFVEGSLTLTSTLNKCLVVETLAESLPDCLVDEIMADVAEKKAYRLKIFDDFVNLLTSYQDSPQFHLAVGQYLGIDRFESGRHYETLSGDIVRSKSEVIIANILHQSGIAFKYEKLLIAPNDAWMSPDFTIDWGEKTFYWEHVGLLDDPEYAAAWVRKKALYDQYFPNQLIVTTESKTLSAETQDQISAVFGVEAVLGDMEDVGGGVGSDG